MQLHAGAGAESSDEAYMRLQLMAERGMITARAAEEALRLASRMHLTKACSIIISGREAAISLNPAGRGFSLWEDEDILLPETDDDSEDVSSREEEQEDMMEADPGPSYRTEAPAAPYTGGDYLTLDDW
jgi:hypothetical protein